MATYLFMDCEMGGSELKYSLLAAYFSITDDKFNIIDNLYLQVKPDDGVYIVSGQGMQINKINLAIHDDVAIPYKKAKPLLYDFLKRNSNGIPCLIPVGHGVKGDISHITDKLISDKTWEQFCTYHYIDTSVFLQILRLQGKIPNHIDGSVSKLANLFDIRVEGEDHDCRIDTLKNMKIFQRMLSL
ncbi:MAG TPA: hypothetical protein PLC59_08120 [Bacteroidales bacterium]|nr:hypothetical protein [Bacteroidales bacterium]